MTEGIDATRTPVVRMTDTNEPMADSRDVAAYFGKLHKNVIQAIRELRCSDDFRQRNFQPCKIKDLTGESTSHVMMTKDGFTFLVMGFTGGRAATYKERYIAAFNAMETKLRAPPADPMQLLNDPVAMRGMLLTYAERVIALEGQNNVMSADVAALDRIAKADGSLNVTEAAKALQVRPKSLFAYLSAHGWIYRRPGADSWLGYQTRVQSGDLEHKVNTVLRADGSERVVEQVRVTPQGLTKLAKLFPSAVSLAA